jgi:hypothetical protein
MDYSIIKQGSQWGMQIESFSNVRYLEIVETNNFGLRCATPVLGIGRLHLQLHITEEILIYDLFNNFDVR